MTVKDIEKIQKEVETKKREKIQLERDVENIETEWKKQGISDINEAKEKVEILKAGGEKLKTREDKLLKRLESEYQWESVK